MTDRGYQIAVALLWCAVPLGILGLLFCVYAQYGAKTAVLKAECQDGALGLSAATFILVILAAVAEHVW